MASGISIDVKKAAKLSNNKVAKAPVPNFSVKGLKIRKKPQLAGKKRKRIL